MNYGHAFHSVSSPQCQHSVGPSFIPLDTLSSRYSVITSTLQAF